MHYRNGREAKNGDRIVQLDYDTGKVSAFGVLYNATPGNDYCNGSIAPAQSIPSGACMCDCLHVDDLAAILAEKGLDKRPAAPSQAGQAMPQGDLSVVNTQGQTAATPETQPPLTNAA